MKTLLALLAAAMLGGCASAVHHGLSAGMTGAEVSSRVGKPIATGRLPGGVEYWDYSSQPFGYTIERVTFTPEGHVHDVRDLLTEQNFAGLQPGMTADEV